MTTPNTKPKKLCGFAVMDPARVREIASRGGQAAQERGTGHKWSHEEATAAGHKGGMATKLKLAQKTQAPPSTVNPKPVAQ